MIERHRWLIGIIVLAVPLSGCGLQVGGRAQPTPAPSARAVATPAAYRVGVVDLLPMIRAHRRWPELDALIKKIEAIELRLSNPPPPPDVPVVAPPSPGPDLRAEAERLHAALVAELDALQAQMKRRIEAFVNDLRAEQEARLADQQREVNVELQKVMEAKRDELQRDLEKFELATMAEYRIPLVNLRVKGDVVGVTNEEEGKRLAQEHDRIIKERDEKIRTRAQVLEKQLQEFHEAKTSEAEARFKTLVASLEEEANAKIQARDAEAQAEMRAAIRVREETLKAAVEARQKLVVTVPDTQVRAAQERYAKQLEAEGARLRTELQALTEQRFRLEDSVLAEIKIEVAAIAQARKIDVVLTRAVAHPRAIDLTRDVIARLKRL